MLAAVNVVEKADPYSTFKGPAGALLVQLPETVTDNGFGVIHLVITTQSHQVSTGLEFLL